jgi:uncharacterized membrane protein YdbT with pleckstrin-like domain
MDYGFTPDAGEVIKKVIHRHIFDILPTFILAGALIFVAGGLAYIYGRYPTLTPFPPILIVPLIGILLIIAMVVLLVGYTVYTHNILVFTNVHLIQVEQIGLFQRRVSQLNFEKIEDVTGRKEGILQTIFDYGNVEVQSASEQEKFIFKNAPHPAELADEALERHEEYIKTLRAAYPNGSPMAPGMTTTPPVIPPTSPLQP